MIPHRVLLTHYDYTPFHYRASPHGYSAVPNDAEVERFKWTEQIFLENKEVLMSLTKVWRDMIAEDSYSDVDLLFRKEDSENSDMDEGDNAKKPGKELEEGEIGEKRDPGAEELMIRLEKSNAARRIVCEFEKVIRTGIYPPRPEDVKALQEAFDNWNKLLDDVWAMLMEAYKSPSPSTDSSPTTDSLSAEDVHFPEKAEKKNPPELHVLTSFDGAPPETLFDIPPRPSAPVAAVPYLRNLQQVENLIMEWTQLDREEWFRDLNYLIFLWKKKESGGRSYLIDGDNGLVLAECRYERFRAAWEFATTLQDVMAGGIFPPKEELMERIEFAIGLWNQSCGIIGDKIDEELKSFRDSPSAKDSEETESEDLESLRKVLIDGSFGPVSVLEEKKRIERMEEENAKIAMEEATRGRKRH
ncbi:hypothetical protein RUND412_010274 [Rhizina undulata]